MGWGNCGTDSKGRPIGYCHAARCDHPGCWAKIDRGLSYACGGMHGAGEHVGDDLFNDWTCEGYFCESHLRWPCLEHEDGADLADNISVPSMCFACAEKVEIAYRTELVDWRQHWPTDEPPLALDRAAP